MSLFEPFHLTQEEAEARLKRSLTGHPMRGEIGLLAFLQANRLDEAETLLSRDETTGTDLRDLVTSHLRKARVRWGTRKTWSVTPPGPVTGTSTRGKPASPAARHRMPRRCGAPRLRTTEWSSEPLETLDESVRAFHTAATQLLEESRTIIAQVGSVQEIGMRLARIEAAIDARAIGQRLLGRRVDHLERWSG
jgi:hypothetical protein